MTDVIGRLLCFVQGSVCHQLHGIQGLTQRQVSALLMTWLGEHHGMLLLAPCLLSLLELFCLLRQWLDCNVFQ